MRVVWWNWNLIGKACAKSLNGAHRRQIVWVARNGHGTVK
jgi:hypothetical protein